MNYDRFLNQSIASVPPSGIRRFFDLAATMKDTISLGVGEPDFKTPYHIRNAAVNSLIDGETQYTANRGLPELREEIALYLSERYGVSYDPASDIIVTIGASEAIDISLRAVLSPGAEVLVRGEMEPLLDMKQGEVVDLILEDGKACGVVLRTGAVYRSRAVILATGTFLAGKIFIGESVYDSGPNGLAPSVELADTVHLLTCVDGEGAH